MSVAFTYFFLGLSEKHPVFRMLTVFHWILKSEFLGLAHSGIQITSGAYSSAGQFQLCNTFRHYISYTLKMLPSLYIGDRFRSQGQRIQIRFMHPNFSVSSAWNWITFPWPKAEADAQRFLSRPIVHARRCSPFPFRDCLLLAIPVPEADLLCGLIGSTFYRAAGIVCVDCEKATLRQIFKAYSCGFIRSFWGFSVINGQNTQKNFRLLSYFLISGKSSFIDPY